MYLLFYKKCQTFENMKETPDLKHSLQEEIDWTDNVNKSEKNQLELIKLKMKETQSACDALRKSAEQTNSPKQI